MDQNLNKHQKLLQDKCISVILLAGGVGARMKAPLPKQYLLLHQIPIARYSFDVFYSMPEVSEIVVVCDPQYQAIFKAPDQIALKIDQRPFVNFALPGHRRQDSVCNGFNALQNLKTHCELVCVHDAARPFIDDILIRRVIAAAQECGAATASMPLKFTVKEKNAEGFVERTLERSRIHEIQTPQVIRRDLLEKGLEYVSKNQIEVTDDMAFAELLGNKVKLVEGSYRNIKITTPEELIIAEALLRV